MSETLRVKFGYLIVGPSYTTTCLLLNQALEFGQGAMSLRNMRFRTNLHIFRKTV